MDPSYTKFSSANNEYEVLETWLKKKMKDPTDPPAKVLQEKKLDQKGNEKGQSFPFWS